MDAVCPACQVEGKMLLMEVDTEHADPSRSFLHLKGPLQESRLPDFWAAEAVEIKVMHFLVTIRGSSTAAHFLWGRWQVAASKAQNA